MLALTITLTCAAPPVWCLLQENVNRLKAYKSNLVVFPRHRNTKKPKVGHTAIHCIPRDHLAGIWMACQLGYQPG